MTAHAWDLPFPAEEYEDRLQRLRGHMQERGLDLLYVTSPPNLTYLLGHQAVWFDPRNVTGLAVPLEATRSTSTPTTTSRAGRRRSAKR